MIRVRLNIYNSEFRITNSELMIRKRIINTFRRQALQEQQVCLP